MSTDRAGRYPTPREFVDEWDAKTEAQRVAAAERIINDAQMASRCFVMAHDDLEHEAQWLRDQKFKVQVEMDKARAKVARVESVLGEWGMDDDGDGFAEAICESGAWRLARDLRAALDGDA